MKEVFVLCGLYGDEDFTCFGVFSSESECGKLVSRLQRCYDGTLWRFYYESFNLDDIIHVDNAIRNSSDY